MRVASRVDTQGLFVEDVLLRDRDALPEGCVESRPPEGLYAPRWNGTSWEEGRPASEIVEALKGAKVNEFAARAVEDLSATGLFTGSHGRDELQAVHNATLIAICEALDIPVDERMRQVDQVQRKAFARKAEVEAAQNPEELEDVTWEGPA